MKAVRAMGPLVVLAVVLVIVGLAAGTLHHDGGSSTSSTTGAETSASAAAMGAASSSTVAPVVDPGQVPDLQGRPAQRDVQQDAPAVRSYERTHRLLEQLPQTYRGVSFTSAGRTKSGRIRITGNPNGLRAGDARRIYRQLLARTHDPGDQYRLVVVRPDAHSP